MKKRIWELDAIRGLCVLGMVIIHLIYNLTDMYHILSWDTPAIYDFVKNWGGVLFLLISGISITLGHHHIKRGLVVFAAGLLVTAVTYGMYRFFDFSKGIMIYFGVLHCLGICMLLWGLMRHLPTWALLVLGLGLSALGFWIDALPAVEVSWLIPVGFVPKNFSTSDYFPLLPYFGFFLLGAFLGRTLYRSRESLFPQWEGKALPIRFLRFCGRQSLWIYLLHQPILTGICMLML